MNFLFLISTLLAINSPLLEELKSMQAKDQEARFSFLESQDSEIKRQLLEAIDQENLIRLKEMISQFGWPGCELVGREGAEAAWLLVQHCDGDLEFQKLCLQLLEAAVERNDAPKIHLAYLLDRVLVHERKPQGLWNAS